jgi:DNA polymerase zeta
MVRRAADLLATGAVMNQVLQPHEAHVPFELQFMMDYNIQGMNLIHLRHAMFR